MSEVEIIHEQMKQQFAVFDLALQDIAEEARCLASRIERLRRQGAVLSDQSTKLAEEAKRDE